MDRFTIEAKTIASLRHINIVEVFDFGVQDDQQFLVMEYIDGQNLHAVCAA
jgi:serine/threonine-protein kinase